MASKFIFVAVLVLLSLSSIDAGKGKENKDKKDHKDKKGPKSDLSMKLISKFENVHEVIMKGLQECQTEMGIETTDKKANKKNKSCIKICVTKKLLPNNTVSMDTITAFAKSNLTESAQGTFLNKTSSCFVKKGVNLDELSKLPSDYTEANCKAWNPVTKCINKATEKALKLAHAAQQNVSGSSTMAPSANDEPSNDNDDDEDDKDDDDDDDDDENTR